MKEAIEKLAKEIETLAELTSVEEGPVANLVSNLRKAGLNDEAKAIVDKCSEKWRDLARRALAIVERL